jgi:hypothetical protein
MKLENQPTYFSMQGDGRPFWRHAVATATGCSDLDYFEELYLVRKNGKAVGPRRIHGLVFTLLNSDASVVVWKSIT